MQNCWCTTVHRVAGSVFFRTIWRLSSKSRCCALFAALAQYFMCQLCSLGLGTNFLTVKNTIRLYLVVFGHRCGSRNAEVVQICRIVVFSLRLRNWDRSGRITTPSKLWQHKMNFGKETGSWDSAWHINFHFSEPQSTTGHSLPDVLSESFREIASEILSSSLRMFLKLN